jgi:hypothetical protein
VGPLAIRDRAAVEAEATLFVSFVAAEGETVEVRLG